MGLDQFATAYDSQDNSIELACWRKHPNLQGWMENLYIQKGGKENFNCVPVRITEKDLDDLQEAINNSGLPETQGFFFGNDSDEYYKEQDNKFIQDARKALDKGMTVEYSSWW